MGKSDERVALLSLHACETMFWRREPQPYVIVLTAINNF
jgi:hypothetical protein